MVHLIMWTATYFENFRLECDDMCTNTVAIPCTCDDLEVQLGDPQITPYLLFYAQAALQSFESEHHT